MILAILVYDKLVRRIVIIVITVTHVIIIQMALDAMTATIVIIVTAMAVTLNIIDYNSIVENYKKRVISDDEFEK